MRRIAIAAALLLACAAPARAQNDAGLQTQLQSAIAPYKGKAALYAIDLSSGASVALNADTPVPTASVIKLTILYDAVKTIQEDHAAFSDKLTLTKANQVQGSGVLALFDTPLVVTFKDALTMMVV